VRAIDIGDSNKIAITKRVFQPVWWVVYYTAYNMCLQLCVYVNKSVALEVISPCCIVRRIASGMESKVA
jgi:hypothetical protein